VPSAALRSSPSCAFAPESAVYEFLATKRQIGLAKLEAMKLTVRAQ
jgi:hypothetical protein